MSLGRSVGLGLALTKVSAAVVTVWPPAASTDVASAALPSQQELPVCAW